MKTQNLNKFAALAVAAALVCLSSCSKTEIDQTVLPEEMEMQEITVKIGIDTKTTLNAIRNKLGWETGDAIGVLNRVNKTANEKLKYVPGGEITVSIPKDCGRLFGYYPYAAGTGIGTYDNSINDGELQNEAGSLNGVNTPMYAFSYVKNGEAELIFKPVSSILALNIYSASGASSFGKITSVTVKTGSIACAGSSTADLSATESPVFAGTKTASRTTLLTPCDVFGEAPADQASIETFPNQIYVNVAKNSYSEGMTFEIRTDAATNNLYTISTSKVYDLTATDLQFININLDKATPSAEAADTFAPESCDESDLLATYLAGGQVNVAGETFSKATNPVYTVKKVSDLTMSDLTTDCGVIFLDNSETPGEVEFKSSSAVKGLTFSPAKIIVGRYSNGHGLPLIKWTLPTGTGGDNTWRISGKNLFKNVHIIMTTGTLNASKAGFCPAKEGDPAELIMDNCQFEASNEYVGDSVAAGLALFITTEASAATGNSHMDVGVGFKTVRVHNTILAYDTTLIGPLKPGYAYHCPDVLEEITLDNCTVTHTNIANRAIVKNTARFIKLESGDANNIKNPTPNLNFKLNRCTFFDLPAINGTSGFICISGAKNCELTNCVYLPMAGWPIDLDDSKKDQQRTINLFWAGQLIEGSKIKFSQFWVNNGKTFVSKEEPGNYPYNPQFASNKDSILGRFTTNDFSATCYKTEAEMFKNECVVNKTPVTNSDYYYQSAVANCGADYSMMTWRDWE